MHGWTLTFSSVQPAINLNEPFQVVRYKLINFLWSHFMNHFNPLDTCTFIWSVPVATAMPLVDLHCRLTLPTIFVYCNCVLSLIHVCSVTCIGYLMSTSQLLLNIIIGVVCQPTSYQLFHHHCFSLSILAVKFIIIIIIIINLVTLILML